MRYFNTHGPVNTQEHYVVPRRALVEQLTDQIEQGKFFTIYAPRQMGKTTLLNQLEAELQARPSDPAAVYLPIVLSFELYESWSATQFWDDVLGLIKDDLLAWATEVDTEVDTNVGGTPFSLRLTPRLTPTTAAHRFV